MTRTLTAFAAVLSLAACATPVTPTPGGSDPNSFVLADLSPDNAPELARQTAARGDHRLIGFIGIALVFPGTGPAAADSLGYRVIDAGGDSFSTDEQRLRADRAYAFAEAWNQMMIFLTTRPD